MGYKSYKDMKNAHRARIDSLPIEWAFSEEQFQKVLKKFNVPVSELMGFPGGGIIRKSDEKMILSVFHEIREEEKEFRKSKKNLVDTFLVGMRETEYGYTGDDEEVLRYCGYGFDDYKENECVKTAFCSARKKYLKSMKIEGC